MSWAARDTGALRWMRACVCKAVLVSFSQQCVRLRYAREHVCVCATNKTCEKGCCKRCAGLELVWPIWDSTKMHVVDSLLNVSPLYLLLAPCSETTHYSNHPPPHTSSITCLWSQTLSAKRSRKNIMQTRSILLQARQRRSELNAKTVLCCACREPAS